MKPKFVYVGCHDFPSTTGEWDSDDPLRQGQFEVVHLRAMEGAGAPPNGEGYYWRSCQGGKPHGPFSTDEDAYINALGD